MTKFIKLTTSLGETLRSAKLTAAEWRLWSFFAELDPFGDSYQVLPDTLSIMQTCQIGKSTFYTAIAKFQELELFDFQNRGFCFRNCFGSRKSENFPENRKTFQEIGKLSEISETSLYTEFQTLSEKSEEIRKKPEDSQKGQEVAIRVAATKSHAIGEVTEVSQNSLVKTKNSGEDKSSERRTGKKVQQSAFDWLPDGPWSIDGKLDPNFRDWLAHDWLSQYGGDIHRRRADVLSHFKKDPANLPIRWEQYQSEFLNRFENAEILVNNGVQIQPEYQETLIANQRAITQSLPQEMNPIATLPNATIQTLPLQGIVQSVEPVALPAEVPQETPQAHREADLCEIALTPSPESPKETPVFIPIPEKAENCQAYKLFKPQQAPEEPITPEQWEEAKAKLAALSNKFNFGKGSPRKNSTPHRGVVENHQEAIAGESVARKQAYCEELNRWIQDPLLREEAMKQVKVSDCYKCLFDEAGVPYQVIWCEEF